MTQGMAALQPRLNKYIPHKPTPVQAAFLWLTVKEAFYGGAGGGGKSDALLMAAAQYIDVPGYAAIIFRRSYADLALPGAIMDRAKDWWMGKVAWNEDQKTFTWPSGATITFAYLQYETDRYRYQGAEFQFIGFDELTQFSEGMYTYLFSRLRKPSEGPLSTVPLRMRSASNPGGMGHDWVKERFIPDPLHPERKKPPFIPAKLKDNPHLDIAAYRDSLKEMSEIERAQIEDGNWDVLPAGDMFDKNNFVIVRHDPPILLGMVRYWDKAGTAGGGAYTAGVKMGRVPKRTLFAVTGEEVEYVVLDVVRGQWSIGKRNKIIKDTAALDGLETQIWVEQEPGSGGQESAEISISELAGYDVHAERVTGEKEARARAYAAQVEHRRVGIYQRPWTSAFRNEHHAFPDGPYKDQVDAAGGGFNKLALLPAPIEQLDRETTDLILNFKGY